MTDIYRNLVPGDLVVLREIPKGLVDGLPKGDQKGISEIVGKPIRLNKYDEDGRAELEFIDRHGVIHFIYVRPEFLRSVG